VRYLLDTNVVIALLGSNPLVVERVRRLSRPDILLPAIVMHELYFGAYKGVRTNETLRNYERLRFEVLSFTSDDGMRAAEIRALLQRRGTPIGPYDVLIAGQALARDLILVTRNTREFERVDGLRLENWEA
jgi:tRNA(fMet)-specific endonuclease VapC